MSMSVKPKPQTGEDRSVCMCRKCSGTGMYVMEIRNGRPWSATGTMCYSCAGRGWIVRYKPGRKPHGILMVAQYDADGKITHYGPQK